MRRVLLLASILLIAVTEPAASASPAVVKLRLTTFIQRGAPERDVLIEKPGLPAGQVDRVAPGEIKGREVLSKTLFTTTTGAKRAPDFGRMMGPLPKGTSLGLTLGQWLAAQGTGTLTATGGNYELKLAFRRLVPNGVYTMWCDTLGGAHTPCGAPDGSENVIKADSSGNATFSARLTVAPAIIQKVGMVFGLAYHSNGKTYSNEPGEFGVSTHVQLAVVVPPLAP